MHWFLFYFLLLIPVFTFAQSDSLTEKKLPEITIVGSRFEQNKKDAIHFISGISKVEIQKANAHNTAVLLEKNAGAYVQYSQSGGGSPILRGFEANKIEIVVDGVRINNAIFRGGHLQNILRIDQNALAAIEILNGPGSLVYGSDALGGVIALRTNKPQLNQKNIGAFVRYGTVNNEKSSHFDLNFGKKNWASFTSLTYSDFGDLQMGKRFKAGYEDFGLRKINVFRANDKDQTALSNNPYLQSPSAYQQFNVLQKVLFAQKNVNHILNLQYSNSSNIPRYDRLSEIKTNGIPAFARWDYGPESHFFAAYQTEIKQVSKAFDFGNISLAYQNFKESRITRAFDNVKEKTQAENLDAVNLNLDFKKSFKNISLQYGAEGILNWVDTKATFLDIKTLAKTKAGTRYPDGGSTTQVFAAYTAFEKEFREKLVLNVGLRFTKSNLNSLFIDKTFFPFPFNEIKQSNSNLSYNLGLKLRPSSNFQVNGLTSSGFRTPNVDDMTKVFESTAGRLIVPNPNLKPEKVINFEINAALNLEKIKIEGAIYTSNFTDILGLSTFTLDQKAVIDYNNVLSTIFASQNLGKATIKGFQGILTYSISDAFEFRSNFNFTSGKYSDKKPLDHIPPFYGRTEFSYSKNKWSGAIFFNYNGAKKLSDFALNGEDNPQYATKEGSLSWMTTNFRLAYKLKKNFQIQTAFENIFDINYRTFASGISAPGRNIILCLRYGK
jgi:hemoglobin/transferrin/lactoferrin receptor protein